MTDTRLIFFVGMLVFIGLLFYLQARIPNGRMWIQRLVLPFILIGAVEALAKRQFFWAALLALGAIMPATEAFAKPSEPTAPRNLKIEDLERQNKIRKLANVLKREGSASSSNQQ